MFGFQPTPPAGSPWRTANWIFPPPPPPPTCDEVDCNNYSLAWYPFGEYDVIYTGVGSSYQWVSLYGNLFLDLVYYYKPTFCLWYSLESGLLPPGFALDPRSGFIGGKPLCAVAGEYTVTVGVRPFKCLYDAPVTTDITFNYYCPAASWTTDPIVFYGTVGNQISYDLSSYVLNTYKFCTQNYYYDGDVGSWSRDGSVVTTTFDSTGTFTSSATVDNSCQNVSANTVGIIYYIT